MNADPHTTLVEDYFFRFIDRGIGADETPLYTKIHDGEPLARVIARDFDLSEPEAVAAIETARQEVWL